MDVYCKKDTTVIRTIVGQPEPGAPLYKAGNALRLALKQGAVKEEAVEDGSYLSALEKWTEAVAAADSAAYAGKMSDLSTIQVATKEALEESPDVFLPEAKEAVQRASDALQVMLSSVVDSLV